MLHSSPQQHEVDRQTDREYAEEQARMNRPWTTTDYQKVRHAAQALVRTHRSFDTPQAVLTVVDGPAFWSLLSALDRSNARVDEN